MIPVTVADVDALTSEVARQSREVGELFKESGEALLWRPDETRWSICGHVVHLSIVNAAYISSIRAAVESARGRGGLDEEGPYRHPWITTRFSASLDAPPKRRLKTFRSMVPDPASDPSEARAHFVRLQDELIDQVEAARGLDLGRIRFGSPFMALLRFSLGTAFATVLAHNRRHIWLIRETMALPGFPGGVDAP